jgi:SAM-dependent methyltransferase
VDVDPRGCLQPWNEIWSHRANNYATALAQYSNPLRNELETVRKLANLPCEPANVIELLAGDGSLAAHIHTHHPQARVYATESSDEFAKYIPAEITRLLTPDPLVIEQPNLLGKFDSVICYAAMHHTEPQQDQVLFDCAQKLLKPNGTLVYVDVTANLSTAIFLNEWVDTHSLYGHQGQFRQPADLERFGREQTCYNTPLWQTPTLSTWDGRWEFRSIPDLIGFICQFFSLNPDVSDAEVLQALESILDVQVLTDQVFLYWPLTSFVCTKAAPTANPSPRIPPNQSITP